MKTGSTNRWSLRIAAGVAVLFGVLTVLSGGLALFGGAAVQAAAGEAVPFVLWFNFLSGFVYVVAGVGIAMRQRWAAMLAIALSVSIAVLFTLFGLHVFQGGAFEVRTVGAMAFRLMIWVAIAVTLVRNSSKKRLIVD